MFASGAGVRFVLLIVLIAASVATTAPHNGLLRVLLGRPLNEGPGCEIAAGFDPGADFASNEIALTGANGHAYEQCLSRFAAPWWQLYVAAIAVFGLAAAVWWAMPWLLARRRHLVPLDDAEVRGELDELARIASLPAVPQILVDPAGSGTAVTIGRPGRRTVVVGAGLLVRGRTHERIRRSVVLHEFAHLRNGDVEISQATVALWWVFAATMLVPFLVDEASGLVSVLATDHTDPSQVFLTAGPAPQLIDFALGVGTAVLVFLSRIDILRSREFDADHLAVYRWNAPRSVWAGLRRREESSRPGRRERWRIRLGTHPTWRARWSALVAPSNIGRPRGLTAFLTGAAAALVAQGVRLTASGAGIIPGLAVAGVLVAGVLGLTTWSRGPIARTGLAEVRWGLLLGLGFVAGGALAQRSLEPRVWIAGLGWGALALLVAAAVAGTVCTVDGLRVARRCGRWSRAAAAVVLVSAGLLIAFALNWSARIVDLATGRGVPFAEAVVIEAFGPAPGPVTAVVGVASLLGSGVDSAVLLPAATLAWLVPFVLLGLRPAPAMAPWMRPSVLAAGAGTALCMACAVLGPITLRSNTEFLLILIASACAGPVVTAVVTARRCGAAAATAAAGVTAVLSAGTLVLAAWVLAYATGGALDGVPLAFNVATCILSFAVFAAALIAALVATANHDIAPDTGTAQDPPPRPRRSRTVAVIGLSVAAIVLVTAVQQAPDALGAVLAPAAIDQEVPPQTSSSQVLRAQARAWWRYGGQELTTDWAAALERIADAGTAAPNDPAGSPAVQSECANAHQVAQRAHEYFLIPDRATQHAWASFVDDATRGTDQCVQAVRDHDTPALSAALDQINTAALSLQQVELWTRSEL